MLKHRDAPLYVHAHELARWLEERAQAWRGTPRQELGSALGRVSRDLLCFLALALTFPETREDHRRCADENVVRLRVLLRLACDCGALSPRQLRHATTELASIGRMIGGWRRQARHQKSGERAQAAPTV